MAFLALENWQGLWAIAHEVCPRGGRIVRRWNPGKRPQERMVAQEKHGVGVGVGVGGLTTDGGNAAYRPTCTGADNAGEGFSSRTDLKVEVPCLGKRQVNGNTETVAASL